MKTPLGASRRRHAGYTLVEMLVALLLLSLGVLACAGALSYSVAAGKASGHRALAAALAAEAADLMRANRIAAVDGAYDIGGFLNDAEPLLPADARQCSFPDCTPLALAAHDVDMLKQRVRASLPQGGIEVARASDGGLPGLATVRVWIVWEEPRWYFGDSWKSVDSAQDCPQAAALRSPQPSCLYVRVML